MCHKVLQTVDMPNSSRIELFSIDNRKTVQGNQHKISYFLYNSTFFVEITSLLLYATTVI